MKKIICIYFLVVFIVHFSPSYANDNIQIKRLPETFDTTGTESNEKKVREILNGMSLEEREDLLDRINNSNSLNPELKPKNH